uniref:Pollen-specific protein SF3 n=1 Tax=Rhizophora mucronata TaxID=61149 RepID=A0A2P2L0I5_RHIMU
MSFTGTQQKCKACEKTVYPMELLSADGVSYHKSCFKCFHCKGTLKLSNYSSMEGVVYCKPHFERLFKETGSFNKNFQSPAKSAEKLTPELLVLVSDKVTQQGCWHVFWDTRKMCYLW